MICSNYEKTDVFRNQTASPIFFEFGMNPQKMAKKIIKKIIRGKRRAIIGIDAHLMNFGYKFFPNLTPRIITAILKKSKIEAFKNIT